MELITDIKLIDKAIKSIQTRGKKLDADIQLTACSALNHCAEHNDPIYINRLIESMPKGSRVNALREFIAKFGNVIYNEETKEFNYQKGKKADIEGAMESMWTEFKPEPEFKGFDLEASIKKLLDQAVKMAGDENPDHQSKINLDLEQLQQLGEVVGMEISITKEVESKAPSYNPQDDLKEVA